jgi:hypothetical protein
MCIRRANWRPGFVRQSECAGRTDCICGAADETDAFGTRQSTSSTTYGKDLILELPGTEQVDA